MDYVGFCCVDCLVLGLCWILWVGFGCLCLLGSGFDGGWWCGAAVTGWGLLAIAVGLLSLLVWC